MTRHVITRNGLLLTAAVAVAGLSATPAAAAPPIGHTLKESVDVLDDFAGLKLKGIPPALLADAHAVAIIPRVIKAGFVVGGRAGHGVVLVRDPAGGWGDPLFVHIGGASVGLQAGVQATDIILVFKTRKGLERLLEGKKKLTLGADAGVAAGPLGRQAEADTDGKLRAEILSYSRSRGLFAGVSLEGAILADDDDANRAFHRPVGPEIVKETEVLKVRLAEMSGVRPGDLPPPPVGRPVVVPPPPGGPVPPPPVTGGPPPRPSFPPPTVPDRPSE